MSSSSFSPFGDSMKGRNSVAGPNGPANFIGESSQKGLPQPASAASGNARAGSFTGDYRFPPTRPPSTNVLDLQVSSLSFADSYRIALAKRGSILESGLIGGGVAVPAPPRAQHPRAQVRPEMFEDKEAVVTRCEVKVGQKVDTTKVRKMRRKAPQLKWNAAPAARTRKGPRPAMHI